MRFIAMRAASHLPAKSQAIKLHVKAIDAILYIRAEVTTTGPFKESLAHDSNAGIIRDVQRHCIDLVFIWF
jgi:hypothetical protein